MSAKQEFVDNAKAGKVLAKKCTKCGELDLATIYFCKKCGNKGFENAVLEGKGTVVTYTIITVPPSGFAKYTPYAWVIINLDESDLKISGFMAGVKNTSELPIGTKAKITGFDDRGILIEKH